MTAVESDPRYIYFLDDDLFEHTDRPGFRRRIVVGQNLEMWFWRIKGGAQGSILHQHDINEQLGIIMRGTLDFRIGTHDNDRRSVLSAGDSYLAPPGVWHGDSVFIGDDDYDEVWIIDVFSPPRSTPTTKADINGDIT